MLLEQQQPSFFLFCDVIKPFDLIRYAKVQAGRRLGKVDARFDAIIFFFFLSKLEIVSGFQFDLVQLSFLE